MSDPRFTAEFWDERYASSARVWSGKPNAALVEEVAGLPVGTALDAGCGEGADACWLAGQGWRVTALDISATALRRAASHLRPELADRVSWRQADLLAWTPEDQDGGGGSGHDLVVAAFMQFPPEPRRRVFAALAAAVAPGGTLLIIGHHPDDLKTGVRRPPEPDLFYTADDLAEDLPPEAWILHTRAARAREVTGPEGDPVTVHDTVLRAQRRN